MKSILQKISSGRWIFTMVCAWAFYKCVTLKVLSPQDIKEIIMYVIIFYFATKDRDSNTPKGA